MRSLDFVTRKTNKISVYSGARQLAERAAKVSCALSTLDGIKWQ